MQKSSNDLQTLAKLLKGKHKKHRAYNAEDEATGPSDSETDDEDCEEIAAPSKEVASKVPKSDWVADSGASSHMTDQLRLFSGPLVRIKRRRIKVGGGKLYANHCGTAVMQDRHRNSVSLSSVLHVPKLGVILFSGRRMCQKGLRGSFDEKGLYMHNRHGKQIIEAPEHGEFYIVERIANGLDDFALLSVMQLDSSVTTEFSAGNSVAYRNAYYLLIATPTTFSSQRLLPHLRNVLSVSPRETRSYTLNYHRSSLEMHVNFSQIEKNMRQKNAQRCQEDNNDSHDIRSKENITCYRKIEYELNYIDD